MAIFDSEKRPRGLRVPSLAAMRTFHSKKSTESVPSDDSIQKIPPPKPAPPPGKELPAPPQDLPAIAAPSQLPDNPYFSPVRDVPERRPVQRVPVPMSPPLDPEQGRRPTGMRTKISQPDLRIQEPSPPASISSAISPAPQDELHVDQAPEPEELIPTPDSAELLDIAPRSEAPSPFVAPHVEPTAPSLNKIHLNCYQEHRAMPVAQNTWCPMPCMTCSKFDTEIRHRCVFCCLRICEGCYQTLQKCKNRSVQELMDRVA